MTEFNVEAARRLSGPDWLVRRRVAAAEEFLAATVPTTAAEEWRYSPIGKFKLDAYRLAARPTEGGGAATAPNLDTKALGAQLTGIKAAATVEVADGHIWRNSSNGNSQLAANLYVGALAGAPRARQLIGAVSDDASDYFTLLNDAFVGTAVVVDVPDGVTIEEPIVVRHHGCVGGVASFPRLIVRLGYDAEATIINIDRSTGPALAVPVVELDVGPAARLGYLNLQQHHEQTWQIAAHTARVERDATLVAASVALGGGYARTRTDTRLVGRGANGDLLSAYLGSGSQILDFRTYQDHAAPDTRSNLLYKGAVGDSARSVYTGLIRVRPDARRVNAFQTNRNLKLSERAWAESVPNLEIENNDVRCSHASAVGPVDADQVFYLESRGVPTPVAERLIVAGFFDEVISALPAAAVRPEMSRMLKAKLDAILSTTETR